MNPVLEDRLAALIDWAIAIGGAAALMWCLMPPARAQVTQLHSCSQTVGTQAAAVPFPASGSTGGPSPQTFLEICNAHASQTLGVNFVGGTASIGAAGTVTLAAGACLKWGGTDLAVPGALSVIGSGASTTTACGYH